MRNLVTVRRISVLGLAVAGALLFAGGDQADARPNYRKAFVKKYPAMKAQVKKVKCNVCHVAKQKKKVRNDYGKALMKALGKKKVKKAELIDAALTKTEKVKNAKGVTFGSLIKAGKLPGTPPK